MKRDTIMSAIHDTFALLSAESNEIVHTAQLRRDELEARTDLTLAEKKELLYMRAIEAHENAPECCPGVSLYSPILKARDLELCRQIQKMKEVERLALEEENRPVCEVPFPPSNLGLEMYPKSFSSKRWKSEQFGRACAHPGSFFEVHTCRGYRAPYTYQTYALLRVDAPYRWIDFSLYYTQGESTLEMVREYLQQNGIDVNIQDIVEETESPISFLRILPTAVGASPEWGVCCDTIVTKGPASQKTITLDE